MQEEKQRRKKKWLRGVLSLFLAIALVCVAIPIESGLAEEMKISAEEVTEPDTGTETESEDIENAESDAETLEEIEEVVQTVTYENSISGKLWLDIKEDAGSGTDSGNGVYDTGEDGVSGYTVSLYKANDTKNAVQTRTTDDTGKYEFTNLEPDSYIVGVAQAMIDGTEYLLPSSELDGTEGDNRFAAAYDEEADSYLFAYTAPVTVEADTAETDLDCGLRMPLGIQPRANTTYYIEVTDQTTYNDSVTAAGGSIPGVSFASNVLTFNTTVDSSDTYVLTGIRRNVNSGVMVNSGPAVTVNITLGDAGSGKGLEIYNSSVSPFQVQNGSKVNLTLGAGTSNWLQCGASNSPGGMRSGLSVPEGAAITIGGTGQLLAQGGGGCAGIGGSMIVSNTISAATNASGEITINSGTVRAEGGISGAGIGAGAFGHGAGGTGVTTINGGTVTAQGGRNGAGIGGGQEGHGGTIHINGGTVDATGGSGGAGIGSGLRGSGGGTITISGGEVTATGAEDGGAGIGGGNASNGGTIKLTGGTIYAYSNPWYIGGRYLSGAGIGGGYMGGAAFSLEIGAAAEVYAYSCDKQYPALWANTITGTGYYANAYFGGGALSNTDDFELRVHSGNYVGSYTGSIPLPARSYCFAYTTGGSSKVYNTRAIHQASGKDHGHVVEYDSNDPNVLRSVNGGQALAAADLYKVKLSPFPFLGDLSHDNVTQTTADLISENHTFSLGTNHYGRFDYDLDGSFTTGNYTPVPWSSTTVNPYTEHLTGLTPNTMYSYRAYLRNNLGDTTSATQQFLTLPKISSWSAAGTNQTDSIVSGSIAASANNNPITGVMVTIANDSGFTSGVQTRTLISGASVNGYTDTSFTANFGTLSAGTYYVKVEVSNVNGTLGGVTVETSSFEVAAGYAITETYVSLSSGTRIDSVGLADNTVYAANSYNGTPPASHPVSGNTYTYLGYYLGTYTPGDSVTSGIPSGVTVSGPFTVSYIYEVLVDVSISKTVTGAYGDPNKAFEITVTLEDSVGTPVSGTYSCAGTLTSIHFTSGQAILNLKHGETITIKDIPKGYTYRVQETDASVTGGTYGVTYTGTGTVTGSGSSADISETLGAAAATVTITNDRSTVPTSGLTGTNYQLAAVGAGALSVLAAAVILLWKYRRKKKCI